MAAWQRSRARSEILLLSWSGSSNTRARARTSLMHSHCAVNHPLAGGWSRHTAVHLAITRISAHCTVCKSSAPAMCIMTPSPLHNPPHATPQPPPSYQHHALGGLISFSFGLDLTTVDCRTAAAIAAQLGPYMPRQSWRLGTQRSMRQLSYRIASKNCRISCRIRPPLVQVVMHPRKRRAKSERRRKSSSTRRHQKFSRMKRGPTKRPATTATPIQSRGVGGPRRTRRCPGWL
jgi:hypothetical protein